MKIAVTSPSFSKNEKLQKEITKYFQDVKLNIEGKRLNKNELIDFIQDADAIIVGLEEIDKEVIDNCSKLKFISKYG